MKKIKLFLTLLIISNLPLFACTTFVLKSDGNILLAKNLDWFISNVIIITNNRGIEKSAFVLNNAPPAKWKSRYNSITFNQFGKEFPLGGNNEMEMKALIHVPAET